jgi:hypothetical protein
LFEVDATNARKITSERILLGTSMIPPQSVRMDFRRLDLAHCIAGGHNL